MKIIDPSFRWLGDREPQGLAILENIVEAGRICYQSTKTGDEKRFVKSLIERGHESVLEHEKISVVITCDRGVSHEIVRHRIASYSQESTRYCNYAKEKFGKELVFIRPWWVFDGIDGGGTFMSNYANFPKVYVNWKRACEESEQSYFEMLRLGATPEAARAVLPNSLKTQIVVTMNLREWRHFFKLRCDAAAHPDMRRVAGMLLEAFKDVVPVVFDDLKGE